MDEPDVHEVGEDGEEDGVARVRLTDSARHIESHRIYEAVEDAGFSIRYQFTSEGEGVIVERDEEGE